MTRAFGGANSMHPVRGGANGKHPKKKLEQEQWTLKPTGDEKKNDNFRSDTFSKLFQTLFNHSVP